jgi:hypothetical protein
MTDVFGGNWKALRSFVAKDALQDDRVIVVHSRSLEPAGSRRYQEEMTRLTFLTAEIVEAVRRPQVKPKTQVQKTNLGHPVLEE